MKQAFITLGLWAGVFIAVSDPAPLGRALGVGCVALISWGLGRDRALARREQRLEKPEETQTIASEEPV